MMISTRRFCARPCGVRLLATGMSSPIPTVEMRPAGTPAPAVGNLDLTGGSASRDELIRDMGRGLLVTALIGATINPTTGDYSRGASGFWVEAGEIAFPVNECTVAGNLREMLAGIVAATDAHPHRARRVPSLLVPGLTVAGD